MVHLPVEWPADSARIIYKNYSLVNASEDAADKKVAVLESLWNILGFCMWALRFAKEDDLPVHEHKIDEQDVLALLKSHDEAPPDGTKGKIPAQLETLMNWSYEKIHEIINI